MIFDGKQMNCIRTILMKIITVGIIIKEGYCQCEGYCGHRSALGCYCDSVCQQVSDCCSDYVDVCINGFTMPTFTMPTTTTPITTITIPGPIETGITTYASQHNDILLSNTTGVSAKCLIPCPSNMACNIAIGEVLWFTLQNQSTPFAQSDLHYDSTNNSFYSYLYENQWISNLNNYIYCQINANDSTSNYNLYAKKYYFGMYLNVSQSNNAFKIYNYYDKKQITMILGEIDNKTATIEVYCTIPILCKGSENCSLPVSLEKESIYDLIRSNCYQDNCEGCSKNIKNQTVPDPFNKAVWQLTTTVEASNKQYPAFEKIQLYVKGNPIDVYGKFWIGLLLPTLTIYYVPKNMRLRNGYSYNDPHMCTLDGSTFEFQGRDGEYLIMENEKTLLRIHSITTNCNQLYQTSGYGANINCNDRIYIQSIDDVIIHDVKNPGVLYYVDLSNKLTTDPIIIPFDQDGNAVLPKAFTVQIKKTNSRFRIITHFSTSIVMDYYGNYEIYPSKLDFGSVYGLLGNYDNNTANDFTELNQRTVTTMEEYFDAYRIELTTRPRMSLRQYYSVTPSENATINALIQYCMCTNQSGDYDMICPLGLSPIKTKLLKGKRSTEYTHNKLHLSMSELHEITKHVEQFDAEKEMRRKRVEFRSLKNQVMNDSCESVLNIPIFQICDSKSLINLTLLIYLCKFDFEQTNVDWSEQYYKSIIDTCTTKLSEDKNTFVTVNNETNPQPQIEVLQQLCVNNCSGNGLCVSGKCDCNNGYGGFDCSINKQIPPIIYNSSAINNICDVKNVTCTNLLLLVDRTTSDMFVFYEILYVDSKNSLKIIQSGEFTNVTFFSDYLIFGKIDKVEINENGSLSVIFYRIYVKDASTSQPLYYAIYKSECHTCENGSSCDVKYGTCDIENNCYKNGDKNPKNETQFCNHTLSKHYWSSSASSSLPPISTKNATSIWTDERIIGVSIGGSFIVIIIVAVTLTIIFQCRRINKK